LWRALIRAFTRRGHKVVFFERDVPYYAAHRDLLQLPEGELVLYRDWESIRDRAFAELDGADAGMITSYCPDGRSAAEVLLESSARVRSYYDMDTGVTLERLRRGEDVEYLPERGLGDFDLVLSYLGGPALGELESLLGAQFVAPLYGSVDPSVHHPEAPEERFRSDLSYLGTYAGDRQAGVDALFLSPARMRPDLRFLIGGSQYPGDFPWTPNVFFIPHIPPCEHAAFYSSSRLTLSVTRRPMAEMGYCPSGRMFEAAACGAPIVTDEWDGLDLFFEPGREILVARSTGDVMDALMRSDEELRNLARAARERTLAHHTADRRAEELENALDDALTPALATVRRGKR
jgi:spore maturation protein CgeB